VNHRVSIDNDLLRDLDFEPDPIAGLLSDTVAAHRAANAALAASITAAAHFYDTRINDTRINDIDPSTIPARLDVERITHTSAIAEIAAATTRPAGTVETHLNIWWGSRPVYREMFTAGTISLEVLRTIRDHTLGAPATVIAALEPDIVTATRHFTPTRLGKEIDAMITALDPEFDTRARRRAASTTKKVRVSHLPRGMARMSAVLGARDAAALLDVLAGRRPGDPYFAPPAGPFLDACDRDPGPLRIARFLEPVIADVEVHPEVRQAWEDASRLLESLGHTVEDVPVPMSHDAVPVFETCWAVLTALSPAPPGREHLLRPLTRWLGERGHALSGPEFGLAIGAMRRHAATALESLASYDAVLTPTLATPPVPVGALRDDEHPERDFEAQKAFTPWTSAWNVTGMPAVSLPLHWTPDGLPVGVMLAARPADDALLLSLAAQVEAAAPWHDRRPPGW